MHLTPDLPENTMTPLSPVQRNTIEELLSAREIELQMRVREAKAAAAERPSSQGPQVEDMAEEGEQRLRTGIEHAEMLRDQEELTDIAAARERLAGGSYGQCADCGQVIAFQRLTAQPTATRCVICQEGYERRHGSALRYSV
jgi:RNA polymerase-binding transcription factor DksA